MRTVNAFVGQPIERLEDFRFVRGRGQFVDDLARNGMLHAAIRATTKRRPTLLELRIRELRKLYS